MKKHVLISSIGIVIGLLVGYYFIQSDFGLEDTFSLTKGIVSASIGLLLAYCSYVLSSKLDQLLPWEKHLTNRFISGIVAHFLLIYLLLAGLYYLFIEKIVQEQIAVNTSILIKLLIVVFIITIIYTIIYFALYSYYTYAVLQINKVAYERKQIDLQLKALKSQLSPHFLFNNLNTISSLAVKDADISEKYIRELAKLYQYTLNSYHNLLVSLNEELSVVKAYFLLLSTRYADSLQHDIRIADETLNLKLPPLTLQMLVENAIKHNVVGPQYSLKIEIYSKGKSLIVKNNLTKAPENVSSFKLGLDNIESRYRLLTKQGIKVLKESDFIVEIPLLK